MLSIRKWVGPMLVGALAVAITACGQRDVRLADTGNSLTGVIKYGDDQVMYGMVFINQGLSQTTGTIREDGTYFAGNCQLGEATIGVNSEAGKGRYIADTMAAGAYSGPQATGKDAGRKKVNVKFIDVPKKYEDPNKSGITTTIEKGENKFDIVLKK